MSDEPQPVSLLDAALDFAKREYPVFPCKNIPENPAQHKAPLTKNGFKDATTNPTQIRRWWTRYPDALIGIPTGAVSRFAVLDLDKKNGKNGFLHVPDWREISPFIVQTGSGGAHLYFRDDERLYTVTNALGLSGVDIKAKGGYIIAPPSPGYTVIKGRFWDPFPKWPEHLMPPERPLNAKPGTQPQAHIDDVRDAVAVIPNDDVAWDDWKKVGLAIWAATGGSAEGYEVFREWSEKSGKYDARTTEKAWDQISRSPPTSIGFGSLFYMAREAEPEWEMRWRQRQDERWRVEEAQIVAELAAASAVLTPELIEEHLAWVRETVAQRADDRPESEGEASSVESEPSPPQTPEGSAAPAGPRLSLLKTAEQFVRDFVPPDYLIDGVLQRRFIYSLTAPTNSGKTAVALRIAVHVALGLPLNGREVMQGNVVYFAGENADDVRMRFMKQCEDLKREQKDMPVLFLDTREQLSSATVKTLLHSDTVAFRPVSLVVVDTSFAFFEGKDENANTDAIAHARMLRELITVVAGGPTILVTCHPTKTPDMTNLIPRGGGAFLNEVDGNLGLVKTGMTLEMSAHYKFRGAAFAPISFRLCPGTTPSLKDSRGRLLPTITAEPITAAEREAIDERADANMDRVLAAMDKNPDISIADIAKQLGWTYSTGEPDKSAVTRLIKTAAIEKLVKKTGKKWTLTKEGREAVAAAGARPL